MKLSRKLLRRLNKKRQEKLNNAIQHLEVDDTASAKAEIEWHKAYSEIVKEYQNARRSSSLIYLGLIVISIIILSLSIRTRSCDVKVELAAREIQFSLTEEFSLINDAATDTLLLANVDKLETDDTIFVKDDRSLFAVVEGKNIFLSELTASQATNIVMNKSEDGLNLFLQNGTIDGRVDIGQAAINIQNQKRYTINTPIEDAKPSLYFQRLDTSSVNPLRLVIHGNKMPLTLKNSNIDHLKFLENDESADLSKESPFRSSITSGKIEILSVDEEVQLGYQDDLIIEGWNKINAFEVVEQEEELMVRFNANVATIKTANSNGVYTNLKPNIMAYLYHNRFVQLMWGAVVFLWSILIAIRRNI